MVSPEEDTAAPSDEEIALCAYRIWLQEGCPHGRDREHWLKAREMLLSARAGEEPAVDNHQPERW